MHRAGGNGSHPRERISVRSCSALVPVSDQASLTSAGRCRRSGGLSRSGGAWVRAPARPAMPRPPARIDASGRSASSVGCATPRRGVGRGSGGQLGASAASDARIARLDRRRVRSSSGGRWRPVLRGGAPGSRTETGGPRPPAEGSRRTQRPRAGPVRGRSKALAAVGGRSLSGW